MCSPLDKNLPDAPISNSLGGGPWRPFWETLSPHAAYHVMDSSPLNTSSVVQPPIHYTTPPPSLLTAEAAGGSPTSSPLLTISRSYPPRDTETYLLCPMYSRLSRFYTPKGLDWSPSQLIGTAVHRGIVAYYTKSSTPLPAAREALEAGFVPQEKHTLEGIWKSIERGVKLGIDVDLTGGGQRTLVCAEEPVYSRRADLVWRTEGRLIVQDLKVRLSLDADKLPYALQEAEHSWQLHDYAYHYGLHFGEPVEWAEMVLIILGPRARVVTHPVHMTPERLAQWWKIAPVIWARKAEDDAQETPPQNWAICDSRLFYGQPCPYRPFCHTHRADWRMTDTLFDKKGGE